MPETIRTPRDLDRAIATAAFCPEPPLSERRAIHESGAWRWICPGDYPPGADRSGMRRFGHWEPSPFATCLVASKALRQKMHERGYWSSLKSPFTKDDDKYWAGFTFHGTGGWNGAADNSRSGSTEETATAKSAASALGLELEFETEWEGR